jgi:glycosyltransferase involved in cell wall biosynthesis
VRVLHVIPSIASRDGGPSTALLGMCRALQSAGVDVTVATTNRPDEGGPSPAHDEGWSGINTLSFRRLGTDAFKWSPGLSAWLRRHVREYDLVHIHAVLSHAPLAAGAACRSAAIPYLVRPLGTLDPWSLRQHKRRKQALMAIAGRRLLAGAAAVHYTSIEEQSLAEAALPWLGRGAVVALGIADDCFVAGDPAGVARRPVVLSLGRLHPKKRVELLIDAFHATADVTSGAGWRLVIAGDGDRDYVSALERVAAAGPAANRIVFAGWVSGAHRLELLRTSRLLVMPSHQENFGQALVEAMAAGIPPVVSPGVNLAREIAAADAGWLIDDGRPMAAILVEAMSAEREIEARGARARQFAERFRWPAIGDELSILYRDIVAHAGQPLSNAYGAARPGVH